MSPTVFVILWSVVSAMFVINGVLWAIDPKLFVLVWRRIAKNNPTIESAEWQRSVIGFGGRLLGCVFACLGFGCFYLLLKIMHVVG
jgi:hypothetical protein